MKKSKKLISLFLSILMLLSCFSGLSLTAWANDVSFTHITKSYKITEANIGACTFEEAKAWVLANWADIKSASSSNSQIHFAYYDNNDYYALTIYPYYSESDIEDYDYGSVVEFEGLIRAYSYGSEIWLCTPAEAPVPATGKCVLRITDSNNSRIKTWNTETPGTFSCNVNGDGDLDISIKICKFGNPYATGNCVAEAPTVEGGDGALVAGLDANGNQYITVNDKFDGIATVKGKYYNGTSETDYTLKLSTFDFYSVETLTLSPDTAQTVAVDGIVAITPTVTPDYATETGARCTIGGTDSSAIKLYRDAECENEILDNWFVYAGQPFYVKGISDGTATITITSAADSNLTASIDITVGEAAPEPATYTVIWNNWDDENLAIVFGVEEGTVPTYTGAEPERAEDDNYTYEFSGWTDGTNTYGLTDALPAVTGNVTYTAVFEANEKAPAVEETLVLTATEVTERSISLEWTNIGGDKHWIIYSANGVEKTVRGEDYACVLRKLPAETEYTLYVRTRSYDANGKAVYTNSEPITVTTLAVPQVEVSSVSVTSNTVTINWNAVERADKYWVYMLDGGEWNVVASRTDDLSYTLTNAEPDTEYQFKVTYRMPTGEYAANGSMLNVCSNLEDAEIISAKTDVKPIYGAASYENGKVTVNWDNAPEFIKAWVLVKENGQTIKTVLVTADGTKTFKATANYETTEYVLRYKLADGTYSELTIANGIQ